MPLEAQGYSDVESGRVTTFLPDWSPARALESGAGACKLLLPYRPDHEASAALQDAVVARAVAACHAVGLPLIVEPIAYPLPPEDATSLAADLGPIVLASVERLRPLGGDILKLQFPRAASPAEEASWCEQIDVASGETPWVLLGGGGDAEGFARDVEVSCAAGASGFIAGRTLWQAALGLDGDALPNGSSASAFRSSAGSVRSPRRMASRGDGGSPSRSRLRRPGGARSAPMHLELVALVVEEYDSAIDFFVGVLGFDLVEDSPSLTNDGRPKRLGRGAAAGGADGVAARPRGRRDPAVDRRRPDRGSRRVLPAGRRLHRGVRADDHRRGRVRDGSA